MALTPRVTSFWDSLGPEASSFPIFQLFSSPPCHCIETGTGRSVILTVSYVFSITCLKNNLTAAWAVPGICPGEPLECTMFVVPPWHLNNCFSHF